MNMSLKIYNSLTHKKEDFEPLKAGSVRMYVCGVTVYDDCHIGHARAAVVFDLIHRALKSKEYQVEFVRNFTDVDDKIIKRASELKIGWNEVAVRYIDAYHRDMGALNLLPASVEPKATDHVPEMLALVQTLIQKGLAYEVKGDVFYSVSKFKGYGKLSHKKIEDLQAGARVDVMEQKKDPLDFALWKKSKPGEPSWDSPWGPGRPGWHLECSAMSMKYLGESFDIHGGGRDLIFPHHENEIAQSEGATCKPFAKYWIHNGFVNIDSEKMSKSLGNFKTIREILEKYDGEEVRYFLLSAHYRSPLDFTEGALSDAVLGLERVYTTLKRVKHFQTTARGEAISGMAFKDELESCLSDDFNITKFLGLFFDKIRALNSALDTLEKKGQSLSVDFVKEFVSELKKVSDVLGLFYQDPDLYFEKKKARGLEKVSLDEAAIKRLINERAEARVRKDWAGADRVRDELAKQGVILKDNPDGSTQWHVK